jgi:hypothetical protein
MLLQAVQCTKRVLVVILAVLKVGFVPQHSLPNG